MTDIDDTLTRDGRLPAAVYAGPRAARDGGRPVIVPVTGRSAGWAHLILHHWPVPAVVAESGGLCLYRDPQGMPAMAVPRRSRSDRRRPAPDRGRGRRGAARASRTRPRERQRLPPRRLRDRPRRDGDTGGRSRPDRAGHRDAGGARLQGAREQRPHQCLARRLRQGTDGACATCSRSAASQPTTAVSRWAFIGDAPNDASMFAAFPLSVGVANLARYAGALEAAPRWLTARRLRRRVHRIRPVTSSMPSRVGARLRTEPHPTGGPCHEPATEIRHHHRRHDA